MASTADKHMNEFATATDGAYIYAEAADGSQVKISKASLASLIKTLIGEATNATSGLMSANDKANQFIAKGNLYYDLNNADKIPGNGIYRFNSEIGEGGASILGQRWGTILHFSAYSNLYIEIFISSYGMLAFRQSYNSGLPNGEAWIQVVAANT